MQIKTHLIYIFLSITTAVAGTRTAAARTAHAQSVNPEIPSQIEFCGQTVDLTRPDMYERYDRELTSVVYGHGNTLLTLKRANKYFGIIMPILRQNGVPDDVAYLACVESYLNPRAYSPAKAAGIWQFIPSAAKQYGLEVNDEVDQRYDVALATQAACRYLKQAHAKYGNWESAMASYNGGQGRISSELERQKASTFFDLWLADETMRYVYRIMAMKAVIQNPCAYGFVLHPSQFYYPQECEEIIVETPVESWVDWAIEHGTTYARLRDENQWIRAKQLTNKNGNRYKVRVPRDNNRRTERDGARLFNHNWIKY